MTVGGTRHRNGSLGSTTGVETRDLSLGTELYGREERRCRRGRDRRLQKPEGLGRRTRGGSHWSFFDPSCLNPLRSPLRPSHVPSPGPLFSRRRRPASPPTVRLFGVTLFPHKSSGIVESQARGGATGSQGRSVSGSGRHYPEIRCLQSSGPNLC